MDLLEVAAKKNEACSVEGLQIEKISNQLKSSAELADQRAREIREEVLPGLLARIELGRAERGEKGEVAKLWKELDDLKKDQERILMTVKGLRDEANNIEKERKKLSLTREYVIKPYEALKAEILKNGLTEDRANSLRGFAKELSKDFSNALQNAEDFLRQQGEPKAST